MFTILCSALKLEAVGLMCTFFGNMCPQLILIGTVLIILSMCATLRPAFHLSVASFFSSPERMGAVGSTEGDEEKGGLGLVKRAARNDKSWEALGDRATEERRWGISEGSIVLLIFRAETLEGSRERVVAYARTKAARRL